ncbi:cytochrome P450 [Xylaria cf. heliscus]|nr:cytochrome P450 [Xylaria cf. heliscus]
MPSPPTLGRASPKLLERHEWPVIGSVLQFYSKRRDMIVEGTTHSTNGNFSFSVGKKHIVNLGGLDGRKTFFEAKGLSVSQGFVELLTGLISSHQARDDYGSAFFLKCISSLSRAERLSRKLPLLTGDTQAFCRDLITNPTTSLFEEWKVTDVTQSVYLHLYKLIHRIVGIADIAEDDKLLSSTLRTFEKFEESTSVAHIVFPWLITPKYVARFIAGARLYTTITRIFNRRVNSSRQEEDAVQLFRSEEGGFDKFTKFTFSILSSSVTMTGAAVIWLTAFLANSPEWQEKCRDEVDSAISKHRTNSAQLQEDILATLPLHDWESSFPTLQGCLHEALRIMSTGTFFRKNVSGGDIPIGGTGEVVPDGSYVAYLPDHVHMDPSLYPNPLKFDPTRFLDVAKYSKSVPHSFLGWGSGRHPCPGMRLAKLEINVLFVYLLANFDIELSDKRGCSTVGTLSSMDRNMLRPEKPHSPTYIRYKLRGSRTAEE